MSLTDALNVHIRDRINFQFASRSDHIQRITVRLSEVNGPGGGEDKCCKVTVTMPGFEEILIKELQADLYVAISRAMDRASRILHRRLQRIHDSINYESGISY